MIALSNKAERSIQVFIGADKEVGGDALIVRFNGADSKLAGKGGYECAVPLQDSGVLEELIRQVREENNIRSYADVIADAQREDELKIKTRAALDGLSKDEKTAFREVQVQTGDQKTLKFCKAATMKSLVEKELIGGIAGNEVKGNDPQDYALTEFGLRVWAIIQAEEELDRKPQAD